MIMLLYCDIQCHMPTIEYSKTIRLQLQLADSEKMHDWTTIGQPRAFLEHI